MNDKAWKTTTYPAIIRYPDRMDLWKEYFSKFDEESACGKAHYSSRKYYEDHFD